jgi:hypothetical protein
VGIAVRRFFRERERFVGRGRQQEYACRSVVEQCVGKLSSFAVRGVISVEEVPEPLELVEEDEVGFERVDARRCQRGAELAHEVADLVALGCCERAPPSDRSNVAAEPSEQAFLATPAGERNDDRLVERFLLGLGAQAPDFVVQSVDARRSATASINIS